MRRPAVPNKEGRAERAMSIARIFGNYPNLHRVAVPILLVGIVLLGAALRIYDLGTESYSLVEVDTALVAQAPLQAILIHSEGRPQLYLILAHFWIEFFGTNEAATRSLSVLAGTLAIPLMYLVGRELFGRKVGVLSSLLMAISEFQIFYSQDLRYYPLFVLMTLCSFIFFIRALKSGNRRNFALYVLATVLLLYSQTPGMFVLAAQGLYFLLQWKRYETARAPWFLSQVVILLAFAPGLVLAARAAGVTILDWLARPVLWQPFLLVARYVFPLSVIKGRHYPSWEILAGGLAFLGIATAVFVTWKGARQWLGLVKQLVPDIRGLSIKKNELLLVTCWLLCPIVLPFILSYLLVPMFDEQYTISASPALYLLLALGLTAVRKVVPELVVLGTLAILIVPGLQDYYVTDVKEQWRQSIDYVTENSRKGDMIVLAPDNGRRIALDWYYRGNLPRCSLDMQLRGNQAIGQALSKCTSNVDRIWVIMRGPENLITQLRAFFLDPDPQQIHLVTDQEFRDISVYLFTLAK